MTNKTLSDSNKALIDTIAAISTPPARPTDSSLVLTVPSISAHAVPSPSVISAPSTRPVSLISEATVQPTQYQTAATLLDLHDPVSTVLNECMNAVQELASSIQCALDAWQGRDTTVGFHVHASYNRLVHRFTSLPLGFQCMICARIIVPQGVHPPAGSGNFCLCTLQPPKMMSQADRMDLVANKSHNSQHDGRRGTLQQAAEQQQQQRIQELQQMQQLMHMQQHPTNPAVGHGRREATLPSNSRSKPKASRPCMCFGLKNHAVTRGKATTDFIGSVMQDPNQQVSPGTGVMSNSIDRLYPQPPPMPSCQQEASQWSLGSSDKASMLMNDLRSSHPVSIGSNRRGSPVQISTGFTITTSQSLPIAQYQMFQDHTDSPFRDSDIVSDPLSDVPVSSDSNPISKAPPSLRDISIPSQIEHHYVVPIEKEGVARGKSDKLETATTAIPCKRARSPDLVHDGCEESQERTYISRKLRWTRNPLSAKKEFAAIPESKERPGSPSISLLLERWIGSEGSAVVLKSDQV